MGLSRLHPLAVQSQSTKVSSALKESFLTSRDPLRAFASAQTDPTTHYFEATSLGSGLVVGVGLLRRKLML